jgi:hypothetical protein
MKNPIGNQQDEIERLLTKSNKLAQQINNHALSRVEAKMAYDSFYIPAMRYSLAITSINQTDLETVQRNATTSLLAALGFNRHMPREVVFCQQKYQGLGLKHLYDLQGADSIRLLLQELNSKGGTTNSMLTILLDVLQLEAGLQMPILEDTRALHYIEWGWLPSIRDFLHHMNGKITKATSGLPVYRVNDSLIMDSPIITTLSRKEQILINQCRLLLQVECLSDITDPAGQQLLDSWIHNTFPKPSRSLKRWPLQGDPGREAWATWKKYLLRAFTTSSRELRNPLGDWMKRNETRCYYVYWSAASKALLLQQEENLWRRFPLVKSSRRQNFFSKNHNATVPLPTDVTPAEIILETQQHYITGKLAKMLPKHKPRENTLLEKILHQSKKVFFQNIELFTKETMIGDKFQKSALIDTASDGSHEPLTGILAYG